MRRGVNEHRRRVLPARVPIFGAFVAAGGAGIPMFLIAVLGPGYFRLDADGSPLRPSVGVGVATMPWCSGCVSSAVMLARAWPGRGNAGGLGS
jgi:hypothetical protein